MALPKTRRNNKLTASFLKSKRVPSVLIAGLLVAGVLGWNGYQTFSKTQSYYQLKSVFPDKTIVTGVTDGDTVTIKNGLSVRLVGIDAPNEGAGAQASLRYLTFLVSNRSVTLEYDAYQDDKYGRILAYIWIQCMDSLPSYCRKQQGNKILINEVLVKEGYAQHVIYPKRKRLKYEDFLR